MKILKLLLEESESAAEVSRKLNITRTAIYGWQKDKKRHPSNDHTLKMLKILKDSNKSKVKRILFDELKTFEESISSHFDLNKEK